MPPVTPWAGWFVCQQHHPEHFWKPDYQRHANGAQDVRRVYLSAPEPALLAPTLAALFDDGELGETAGGLTLRLPRGEVEVLTPAAIADRIPGLDPALLGDPTPRFAAALIQGDAPAAASLSGEGAQRWIPAGDNEGFGLGFEP